MELRFHRDSDTGLPHIYSHDVDEDEVVDVLRKPLEEIKGRRTGTIAHGQTRAGRYLKVIYVPDEGGAGIFVITAYDLPPRQVRALRRRLRRRPR
ncbi:MAG: hypothetical protein QOE14_2776 [Humisphaera sp.]|nr:hypothetical protein [Humisphaera sp.]